jgi:hypothetical protein
MPKFRQIDFAWPMWEIPVRLGRKAGDDAPVMPACRQILVDYRPNEIDRAALARRRRARRRGSRS